MINYMGFVLLIVMVGISIVNVRTYLIPNAFTYPLLIVGIAIRWFESHAQKDYTVLKDGFLGMGLILFTAIVI